MVLIAGSVHSRGHLLGMCMIPWRSEFQQLSELVADTCRPEARSLKRAMQIPIYPHGIAWVSYIYIWYHGIIQYPPAGSVIVIIFKFSHSISSICKCQSIYIQAVSYMVSYANSPMTLSLSLSFRWSVPPDGDIHSPDIRCHPLPGRPGSRCPRSPLRSLGATFWRGSDG